MARTQLPGVTSAPGQLQERTDADLWGFDGSVWRRISVDGTGALIIAAGVVGVSTIITANTQIQHIETTAALGAGASFTSPSRDYINFESMSISVFLTAGGVGTNVDIIVENSNDGVTFRQSDLINVVLAAAQSQSVNRVYSVSREFNRVSLVNNTANAMAATELTIMRKPIS